jgi:cytochrome c-type biogenesis protein CcmE
LNRRLAVVFVLILGAIGFLVVKGLGDATTYFRNADEAMRDREELGTKRFRLQGTVVPGSVEQDGADVLFQVEYHCVTVDVHATGDRPELFRPAIPVVLEGRFAEHSDVFESDRVIVKHTEEYRTKEKDRLALAEKDACP